MLHPDTAHEGGPNYSCEIRKMVYFRLKIKCNKNKNKNNDKIRNEGNVNVSKPCFSETSSTENNGNLKVESTKDNYDNDNIEDNSDHDNNHDNINKMTERNESDEYTNLITENIPPEHSSPIIFNNWEEVVLAHSTDMWADLKGVKALG